MEVIKQKNVKKKKEKNTLRIVSLNVSSEGSKMRRSFLEMIV